jgi:DNA mismatch repair protein MutL
MTGLPRVLRLPSDLVDKIAAGEVVERPASVVKELVENALDAGARSVAVEIEAGGKGLIRVRDDGHGMVREDARLAVERHATSKLRDLDGLQAIATHGFRGEALPSIGSVSHLVLRTRDASDSAGTEVELLPARAPAVRDAGHPVGTTVEVRDLFGSVPARRKFLRAESTEASHVAEAVTLLALARPETGFTLRSGGRTLVQAPPVADLGSRIYQLFGEPALQGLVPVDGGEGWARVRGFVSRPDRPGAARASLRLYVNGRAVRDRGLHKAVSEAYRHAGAGDHRPEAFLFLELPPGMVDVNVHPAKTEVRFADPRTVWTAVERAVRGALSEGARREEPHIQRVAEAAEAYVARATASEPVSRPLFQDPRPPGPEPVEAASAMAVLGQHRLTYIVASDGDDLVLVDQHTAHERVRFEGLLRRAEKRLVESQRLLEPEVVPVPPALQPLLDSELSQLLDLGFDAEPFGGGTLRIRAVPALLGPRDAGAAVLGLLKDLLEREERDWIVAGSRDRLAATLACHSAVRAGQTLTRETMAAIVTDLRTTAHPGLCPHGRPTLVRVPRQDVARWFGRTGWGRH